MSTLNPGKRRIEFIKFGGSLITDKHRAHTPRLEVLARLAREVANALTQDHELRLVIGNGAGSYGHIPARKYGTRQGVRSQQEWHGFAEVWREAAELNRLVIDALQEAGLPAIAIHPSAAVMARDGKLASWDLGPMMAALAAGLLPVVHGDVIFDQMRGGTILSTEDMFEHLASHLHPRRILLAGQEDGVWTDYPTCTKLIDEITPETIDQVLPALGGSSAIDVTGGMASKVLQSMALIRQISELEVMIFSGETPGVVEQVLLGARAGTRLHR